MPAAAAGSPSLTRGAVAAEVHAEGASPDDEPDAFRKLDKLAMPAIVAALNAEDPGLRLVYAHVDLPGDLATGDVLAVPATGAYGRSMASNYNLFTRPGVAWVDGGRQGWVLRPETIEDLLRLEGDA